MPRPRGVLKPVMVEGTQTDRIDVAYVARLARLQLSEQEITTFGSQLKDVVAYVQKLKRLDLRGIEPMSHAHPVLNVFREDAVKPSLDRERVLANAPQQAGDLFVVPKIVE